MVDEIKKYETVIIKNVNIVDVILGEIVYDQSVYIKNGRFSKIRPARSTSQLTEENEKIIYGNGCYMSPGLINMHTHLGNDKNDLLLYLVNGVTTIRNMWGYESFDLRLWLTGTRVFNHLKLKKRISQGFTVGPRIFTCGPILDGEKPFFPSFMPFYKVKSKREIEKIIENFASKGYDFVKIYSMLSSENFQDVMDIAKHYKIDVAGHIPDDVSMKYALESGIKSMEHLYGYINPYFPNRNIKQDDVKRLAHITAQNEVWNAPTLIAHERLANIVKQEQFESENQMKYVSKRNLNGMRFLMKEAHKVYISKKVPANHEYEERLNEIVSTLHSEGAEILLGTDKAVPYVVAGFSEHYEMELLQKAGLSSLDVLRAATINGAKCLNKEHDLGSISIGKLSDFILTTSNPLENINALSNHNGVMAGNLWLSRNDCDTILDTIQKQCK